MGHISQGRDNYSLWVNDMQNLRQTRSNYSLLFLSGQFCLSVCLFVLEVLQVMSFRRFWLD